MSEVAGRAPSGGPATLRGTFRRFASGGRACEVVAAHPERATANIHAFERGEEFDCPLEKIAIADEA